MKFSISQRMQLSFLYDTPGEGGPGGGGAPAAAPPQAPAPSSAPAPAGGGAPAPTFPAAAPPAAPGGGAPPAPPARQFTYTEDRTDWVPPHRLSAVAQRAQQMQTDAERYRRMLEAGTGVNVPGRPEPVDPAILEARETFDQVFPGAGQFFAEAMPLLMKVAEAIKAGNVDPAMFGRIPDAVGNADHSWQQHGRTTLNTVYGEIAKAYQIDALTPRQSATVGRDFAAWIEADKTRISRYAQNDPALTAEFVQDYTEAFVSPLRRNTDAAALAAARRNMRLPAPPVGGPPAPSAPPAALSEDQVHDNAWNQLRASLGQ